MSLRRNIAGVHDHEVLAFDETERSSACAEQPRRPPNELAGDVGRRHGDQERGRELLQFAHLARRFLGGGSCSRRPFLASSHHEANPDDDERHDERHRPAHVIVLGEPEPGGHEQRAQGPADDDGDHAGEKPPVPDRYGNGADEQRVERFVRRFQKGARDTEGRQRQSHGDSVPGERGSSCGLEVTRARIASGHRST